MSDYSIKKYRVKKNNLNLRDLFPYFEKKSDRYETDNYPDFYDNILHALPRTAV